MVLLNSSLAGQAPENNVLKTVWVDQISLDILDLHKTEPDLIRISYSRIGRNRQDSK